MARTEKSDGTNMPSLPGELEELYREVILDHYRSPRNHHPLSTPSSYTRGYNPLCGDDVELFLKIENSHITEVGFKGQGCSISQSSTSMMTESIQGKTLGEAEEMAKEFREFITGIRDTPPEKGLPDLEALEGVKRFPVRVKCATLAWNTLQEAIRSYRLGTQGAFLEIKE